MIRSIHKAIDAKEAQYIEEGTASSTVKIAGLGLIEGLIDGFAIVGAMGYVLSVGRILLGLRK